MQRLSDTLVSWASVIEPATLAQARATSTMPFIRPHLALMPDAHLGKGATVGSVIPTHRAIIPAAVGVDIGCGMIAMLTQFVADDLGDRDRSALRVAVEQSIPLSAGHHNTALTATAERRVAELSETRWEVDPAAYTSTWPLQLGSLGSGNHFLEVSLDELDRVWLFLHSGSRGIGNRMAQRHITVAQEQSATRGDVLPDPDLAYLAEDTDEFWAYLRDLRWAQHFALLNREEMMDRLAARFGEWAGTDVVEQERINCHHNFTQQEEHAGETLWVSRKGAIEARPGQAGLIPGSMGTASYVVAGLGNADSLNSSPHGAGRMYSRNAARKRFTLEDLRSAMAGIEFRDTAAFLDEHPGAYKDIDVVMQDARELVEVRHTLRQIVNVKGD